MSLRLALGWEGLGTGLRDGLREREELLYATVESPGGPASSGMSRFHLGRSMI